MTVLSSIRPVARKRHRCVICGGTIPKGQQYHRWVNADQGTVISSAGHDFCVELNWWGQQHNGWDDELLFEWDFRAEYLWWAAVGLAGLMSGGLEDATDG